MTDDRLVELALAYAQFRIRVCGVLGLFFLVVAVGEAVNAAFGTARLSIVYAVLSGAFVLTGSGWFWQANRCKRGAQVTAQECAGRRK